MICDRAERRIGGASAPVFCGGFLGFPRKVGSIIGGIFISLPQEWLYDRVGRRRLRRFAFCQADPVGQPSPASRLRRLFWGSGAARSVQLSGGFLSLSRKNGLMIGGGRRRLRRSAFCRADPAGQPSPASRLRRLFWAAGLLFCRKKRKIQRGSRASSMRRSSRWG